MKKLIFVVALVIVWQEWDSIDSYINPVPDYASMHEEQVVLYATEWCGYCRQARNLMDQHNISFYEYDIEKSDVGRQQYEKLGGNGVPVLLIGSNVLKGYNPSKILNLTEH